MKRRLNILAKNKPFKCSGVRKQGCEFYTSNPRQAKSKGWEQAATGLAAADPKPRMCNLRQEGKNEAMEGEAKDSVPNVSGEG